MLALPTSTLGLELGPSAASAPGLSQSTNGSFAVQSYSPTHGAHGILFTVNVVCSGAMPAKVYDAMDLRLIADDKVVCTKAIKGADGQVTLRALLGSSVATLSGCVSLSPAAVLW